tara:strand:+ start:260 stop:1276 length:1017 start_codon:yes stop_codon:yes gene_type:complete
MDIYSPNVKQFNHGIKRDISFQNMKFIGFDFIVDSVDGTPYLLEGNATPYGIQLYQKLYDNSLAIAIQNMFIDQGVVGINIDLDSIKNLESHKNRYVNTKYITNLFDEAQIHYITFSDNQVIMQEDKWQANGQEFDLFLNRCFGIPESYRRLHLDQYTKDILPNISSIELMADKWETQKKVNNVIPSPYTIKVNSKLEECFAFEEISPVVKKKYGNKVTQKTLIKPIDDTGGNGIQFIDCIEDIKDHTYPSLVQERIIPELYDGRAVDLRVFFINGWVAKPIARVASERFNNKETSLKRRLLTALCSGGSGIRVSDQVAEKISDYVMATSIELEKSLQ